MSLLLSQGLLKMEKGPVSGFSGSHAGLSPESNVLCEIGIGNLYISAFATLERD